MSSNPAAPLRVWPGILIVLLQWATLLIGNAFPGTPIQFMSMMGAPIVGTLLLLIWWVFLSRASWRERGIGALIFITGVVAAFVLSHKTMLMALMIWGVPICCAAFVAAVVLTRNGPESRRRLATIGALAAVIVTAMFFRGEGVRGSMAVDLAPRFSKTAEARLLEQEALPRTGGAAAGDAAGLPEIVAWPEFRGPRRDGILPGVRIDEFSAESTPSELWRRPIGPGWGSFSIWGDRLFTQEQRGEKELISCYRTTDGEPLWFHEDEARFEEPLAGPGPRSTPTIHQGRLYAFGATGLLNALNAVTGESLWQRDAAADTAATIPEWGFSASPLVVDDLVVVHTGGPEKALVAYALDTGEPRWFAAIEGVSYSSAHLATIAGVRQLLILTGEGAAGVAPETGEVLWNHSWPMGGGGSRIVQPAFTDDGDLLIGTGFGMGLQRVTVERSGGSWSTRELWTSRGLKPYFNDFVVHRGHAFGFDGKIMAAVNLESGDRAWKGGRYGHGQILLLPDQELMIVLAENGDLALVRTDTAAFDEVTRIPAIEGKTWNHPVLVDGVLFVRNGEEMAAFRIAPPMQIAAR